MYTHSCLKCKTSYQDNDPDPYYCESCNAERKALAAQIDAKVAARPRRESVSELQIYNESPKVHGFMHVKL